MKRIIIITLFLLMASTAFAQTDWAGYNVYEQANKNQVTAPLAVFMGNSITQGWVDNNPNFFTENNYLGRGISGQTTYEMLARFQADVVALNPKYVVILAGTNDLALNQGYITSENMLGNIKSMCQIALYNNIEPVLCSVLPVYEYSWRKEVGVVADTIKNFNKMLEGYAKESGIKYVDYHSPLQDDRGGLPEGYSFDGVHLTGDGYRVIEAIIKPILK